MPVSNMKNSDIPYHKVSLESRFEEQAKHLHRPKQWLLHLLLFITPNKPRFLLNVLVLCLLLMVMLSLVYAVYGTAWSPRLILLERAKLKEIKEIIIANEFYGPLDIYGLKRKLPKSSTWLAKESTARENTKNSVSHLVAAEVTHSKNDTKFVHVESLVTHIRETFADHQRFLTNNIVDLQRTVSKLPNGKERTELLNKLILLSSHSSEYNRIVRKEVSDLSERVGISNSSRQALRELASKIRNTIQRRQAYKCEKATTCEITNPYGFASGVHDVLWCLIQGYLDDHRVILDSSKWHYFHADSPWEKSFQQMGRRPDENCELIGSGITPKSRDLAASLYEIPRDIAEVLVQHHPNPYAWWLGQFMGYILRPSDSMDTLVHEAKRITGFSSPIVGLHIRRTDKMLEAAYHSVEEYMVHAEEYYRSHIQGNVTRKVFVATDEAKVVDELREKFPDYVIISNVKAARLAHSHGTRYSKEAFQGLLIDILLLTESDKVVCTLSSGLCRIVYELLMAHRDNAADALVTLDISYFFAYRLNPPRRAIYAHEPIGENDTFLSPGDCIAQTHYLFPDVEAQQKKYYDGFTLGTLCGSRGTLLGTYPIYKTLPTVIAINTTTSN